MLEHSASAAQIRVNLLAVLARDMASTEDLYRAFCRKLLKAGVAKKTIGARAGHKSGWATKWLNDDEGRLSTDAMDGLDDYFAELAKLIEQRPRIRHAKEPPSLERKSG